MTRHYAEELQDALDGRLVPEQRVEIEEHLKSCVVCAGLYERLRWTRDLMAEVGDLPLPSELSARVSAVLEREDQSPGLTVGPPAMRVKHRGTGRWAVWGLPLAAALAVAVGVSTWLYRSPPVAATPQALATAFDSYKREALSLALSTSDISQLEAFFGATDLDFSVRVLDLDMMGYRPLGGRIVDVDGRRAALLVYQAGARVVLCIMYRGDAAVDGRGGEVRAHAGFDFYVHRINGKTVVLWQEGSVTCGLVGDGDPQAVIDLAFAKAMKPA